VLATGEDQLVLTSSRLVTTLGLRFGPDVANSMEVASLDEELA